MACNTSLFESSTLKIGYGGDQLTTRTRKTLIWAKKWHFFGQFPAKNGVFLVVAALKQLFNGFNGMRHIFIRVQHPQNRVGGGAN